MRFLKYLLAVASVLALGAGSSWAQANPQPKQFGGLKLVDPQNPRGLETDVSMRVDADRLVLVDPVLKKEVKSLPYSSITSIEDTYSITPPLPAGVINRNSTGAASMPSYLGKEPRHWWTINSDGSSTIIRVSSQVYKNLKTAVGEHNVKIEDADAKKKKTK
jgi:hypothetical protein